MTCSVIAEECGVYVEGSDSTGAVVFASWGRDDGEVFEGSPEDIETWTGKPTLGIVDVLELFCCPKFCPDYLEFLGIRRK